MEMKIWYRDSPTYIEVYQGGYQSCRLTASLSHVNNVQLQPCSYQRLGLQAGGQAADLDDVSKVTVGSQLQALPLRPVLDGCETLAQRGAPVVAAQATAVSLGAHQLVEEPGAGKVKELGEELDGQSRIDPAAAQQGHGVHQRVQDHLCRVRRHQ